MEFYNAKHQRARFSSSSETFIPNLFNKTQDEVINGDKHAEIMNGVEAIASNHKTYDTSYPKRKDKVTLTDSLKTLESEIVTYDLEESQKVCECGGTLHHVKYLETKRLKFVPAKYITYIEKQGVCCCRECENKKFFKILHLKLHQRLKMLFQGLKLLKNLYLK